jgi:integrase
MRLNDKLIRKHPRPESGQSFLWDDLLQGFGVRFTPTRTSYVIQWREAGGRKPRVTLDQWPAVSVEDARTVARGRLSKVTGQAKHGGGMALHTAMRTWQERCATNWRPRYAVKVDAIIASYVEGADRPRLRLSPATLAAVEALGSTPVAAVKRADVMAVADSIKQGAADQFLAICSSFFNWAYEREWVESNPARNRLKVTGGRRIRQRRLTDAEMLALWRAFEAQGDPAFGAFQLLVLTGARRREVTGMRWDELDLEAGTWTLPPERRKTGGRDLEPFVISLAPQAVAAIQRQPVLEGSPFVFWGRRDRRPFDFQHSTIDRVQAAASVRDWRLHDLRRYMRSGLAALGVSQAVAELTLGHITARAGLVGVYDVHDYADEKREAWQRWAVHVAKLTRAERAAP